MSRNLEWTRQGALWVMAAASANPDTTFTAQTSFAATTPFLLIRKTETTFSKRLIPQRFIFTPSGTPAAAKIKIAVFKDLIDRADAGGTELAYYKPGLDEAVTAIPSGWTAKMNATAAAAGANVQLLDSFEVEASNLEPVEYNFTNRAILNRVGSILVFAWAAGTGPTYKVSADAVEEKV